MTLRTRRSVLALLVVPVLLLAGCGSESTSSAAEGTGAMTVSDATIDVPANPSQAAVRMIIENGTDTDDELVSATASVADGSTMHESGMDGEGRATMETLDGLAVPAGETVIFAPGGLHVMLTGLTGDLAAGDTFDIELTFAEAGAMTVPVTVEAGSAAAGGEMEGMDMEDTGMDDMDHEGDTDGANKDAESEHENGVGDKDAR